MVPLRSLGQREYNALYPAVEAPQRRFSCHNLALELHNRAARVAQDVARLGAPDLGEDSADLFGVFYFVALQTSVSATVQAWIAEGRAGRIRGPENDVVARKNLAVFMPKINLEKIRASFRDNAEPLLRFLRSEDVALALKATPLIPRGVLDAFVGGDGRVFAEAVDAALPRSVDQSLRTPEGARIGPRDLQVYVERARADDAGPIRFVVVESRSHLARINELFGLKHLYTPPDFRQVRAGLQAVSSVLPARAEAGRFKGLLYDSAVEEDLARLEEDSMAAMRSVAQLVQNPS